MVATERHPNSKTITIFRAGSTLSRAQGTEVDDFFSENKISVGSYFDSVNSQKVGTGLSFEEEKLLLPHILNVEPSDKDFRMLVANFYSEILTPIPHGRGQELEVGLESNNDKPVGKDNMPIKIMDYIRYRHALGHPWMAPTKEVADGDQTKQYYIFDKARLQKKAREKGISFDAAMEIYLQVKKEPEVIDQMLVLLGTDPRTFTGTNAGELKAESLRDKISEHPERFIEVYKKGDLDIRAWLAGMINTKVLKEVGARIIDAETDKLIGNNLEEAIYYFKDEENEQTVSALKARYQEAMAATVVPNKKKTVIK